MSDKQQYSDSIAQFQAHRNILTDTLNLLKKASWSGDDIFRVMQSINLLVAFRNQADETIKKLKSDKKSGEPFPADLVEQPEAAPVEETKQEAV